MSTLRTAAILACAGLLLACVDESYDSSDPRLPERPDSPGLNDEGMATCGQDEHCAEDEACTQGGLCINITGARDATEILARDLEMLPQAVGTGVPYRLPENAILRLQDLSGDGIALRIDKQIHLDGAGSLFLVDPDITALQLTPSSAHSSLRNFRIDPTDPESPHQGIGIDIQAPAIGLTNLYFWRMGIGVRADSELIQESERGLQGQQWARIVFDEIHHHATLIRGAEAHAGVVLGTEILGGAGHTDASTGGNTYLGVTAENTTRQSIELLDEFASSTVAGLHLLGSSPPASSASIDDFHIGGNAIIDLDGPGDRVGQEAAILHFLDPEEGLISARIPGDGDAPFQWEHLDEATEWSLRITPDFSEWILSVDATDLSPFTWTAGNNRQGPAQFYLFE